MNDTRYTYDTVPITFNEASRQRLEGIVALELQMAELQKELDELIAAPLPTERQVQIELHPGDEGYEDASYEVNLVQYQGNVTWQNIENSTPPKPE